LSPGNTSKAPAARSGGLRRWWLQYWLRLPFWRYAGLGLRPCGRLGQDDGGSQSRHLSPDRAVAAKDEEGTPLGVVRAILLDGDELVLIKRARHSLSRPDQRVMSSRG
ncbi:hypothetical protein, partial [Streptomyces sp. NPDC002785]|uniref:hypothetical protein n=1 Tax=Streptomyces sp. NPDC002785 TaxID=3154543 RepID=UPI0033190E6B